MISANKKAFFIFVLIICWVFLSGFTSRNRQAGLNQRGNEHFTGGDLQGALSYYTRALSGSYEQDRDLLHMNVGNVFYKMGEYDKAVAEYMLARSLSDDDKIKGDALYNMGNTFFMKQDYEKAVQAYMEALRLNPGDDEAKYNFELALNMLKDQEMQDQEEDGEDSGDEGEDTESQDESGDEDDNDGPEEDPAQDQDMQDQADSDREQQEIELDQQEMQRMLDMIGDEDRDTQEERIRSAIIKDFPQGLDDVEKDW